MRYVAPPRGQVDPQVFSRMPLSSWGEYAGFLQSPSWPSLDALNALWPTGVAMRFAAQDALLLADGMHYEQRIAEHCQIATREENWHDLLNALIWLRYPDLKRALNRRQVEEIARMGPTQRSRAQYALTHFDEGGLLVAVSDPFLMGLWDAHDWHGLFWRQRDAWLEGSIRVELFGHALLEQALTPSQLLVGKALVFQCQGDIDMRKVREASIDAIAAGELLLDPQELRPLPLPGLPGWHAENEREAFHRETVCYQPRRPGREYPLATVLGA